MPVISSFICCGRCCMKLDVMLKTRSYIALLDSSNGAVCYRLCHTETNSELLRTPESEEMLNTNRFLFGQPILFPPNRIRGGEFTFDGRVYCLPINEPATESHLHGTLYRLPFVIEEQSVDSAMFSYTAKAGEYLKFPHDFRVMRKYTLTDEFGLQEQTQIYNDSGLTMPVMLAYHTTFNIPFLADGKIEDYRLSLPVGVEHKRDEKYLPTCEYEDTSICSLLRDGSFVPCEHTISAFYKATGNIMYLRDHGTNCTLEYSAEGFSYWMLYNGGAKDFLTVEPQTCAIDAFHIDIPYRQAGVISLEPGQSLSFKTAIRLIKG